MPWITVIKGKSFTVKTDDGYELEETIEGHEKFKLIKSDLEKSGLYSIFIYNDDNGKLVLSAGKELHNSRHIYQGQTFTLDESCTEQDKVAVEAICTKIEALYNELGLKFEVKEGLLVGQFD